MDFCFGKTDWNDIGRGQERCFLLTNGLGGYSSLSLVGSCDRRDQALLMAALVSPNVRWNLIANVAERLVFPDASLELWSQEYLAGGERRCHRGYLFLNAFQYDICPTWTYQARGVEVRKTLLLAPGENTAALRYQVYKKCGGPVTLTATPLLLFACKGREPEPGQRYELEEGAIVSRGVRLFCRTNGRLEPEPLHLTEELFYDKDFRDGRQYLGRCAVNHHISFEIKGEEQEFYLIYSLEAGRGSFEELLERTREREEELSRRIPVKDEVGRRLVRSACGYISRRDSTGGKTLLAGFPFFEDWGRDTMIALPGCALAAGRYEDAADILRTFMRYCRRGLMPNLFPEGGGAAFYNTADASLLFVQALYEYYHASGDAPLAREALPVIDEIIRRYREGTDYHIRMDEDGLIRAGEGLEQLTWMDVRWKDILPTPRHGKPVEINACWYNALCIADELRESLLGQRACYGPLREQVKKSFLEKFWMETPGYLRDVVSQGEDNLRELEKYRRFEGRECAGIRKGKKGRLVPDEQIRPNQIWALSLPYSMLDGEKARRVLDVVYEKLYTPLGLRTLDPEDEDYHPFYGGDQMQRDMAYHQGTVWPYLLGEYYLAFLRWAPDKRRATERVRRELEPMEACLREGCLGHIAEVYDGEKPNVSKGCFAQAWSVGELARVYAGLERLEREVQAGMTDLEKKLLFESAEFEKNYTYEGDDLGAVRGPEGTVFKVWAPTASQVWVNLYRTGGEESGDSLGVFPMERGSRGVWEYRFPRDLKGVYYTYSVSAEGEVRETGDLYARACGVNGRRSMVVDLAATDPKGWEKDRAVGRRREAGAVYELHIKDFSHDPCCGVPMPFRGKYLAFTCENTCLEGQSTCLAYLKELGIRYVQLLPFYDFGSVEEGEGGEDAFNWGYDPVNYMVPEGSYATDPFHGEVRIREVKSMIAALHRAGIGVVMDVVFNHTYSQDSWFQRTVPGYYYRTDARGHLTNGSACGNDTASERKMYRKYMVDAVVYWAREYHLDGFRFDLMGLHDAETMGEIRRALDGLEGGREILMYGEPWSAGLSGFAKGAVPALRRNIGLLDEGIGMFCDATRDAVKGSVFWREEPGYVNTGDAGQRRLLTGQIRRSVLAWTGQKEFGLNYVRSAPGPWEALEPFYPRSPRQIVSYVSAHDNWTLWDKLRFTLEEKPDFGQEDTLGTGPAAGADSRFGRILQVNRMAAGIVFTCLGQPFLQAGEEFARTKKGEGNSYNLSPELNRLDWGRRVRMEDLVSYYRDLIAWRREKGIYGERMEAGPSAIRFLGREESLEEPLVGFAFEGTVVYYNPLWQERRVGLPGGEYALRSDGARFWRPGEGPRAWGGPGGAGVLLAPKSVTIWEKR